MFQAITHAAGFADAARCSELTESSLARIVTLDLRDKRLVSLKPGDFAGLSGLQTLHLNRNELTELPEDIFAGLSGLRNLNLSDNDLTRVPENVLEGLSGLQSLQLTGNFLNAVPEGLFTGLSGLHTVNLGKNRLTALPAGLFSGLADLHTLQLTNNRLAELPAALFAGLPNLHILHRSGNRLSGLSAETFSGLSALENLTLGDNDLFILPEGLFKGLSGLKQLNLRSSRLRDVPSDVFDDVPNLEYLSLAGNQLSNLSDGVFENLSKLKILVLENSRIARLPVGIFSGLSSLENLRLNSNFFTELPSGLFDGLSSLRLLDLRRNRLTKLPDHLFSKLPALPQLFLSGNTSDPLPLPVTLEKVGEDQFKAVVPTGAPFGLELPVSIAGGAIEGAASSVTLAATEEESAPLRVTRQEGSLDAVTADFGSLPGLPGGHLGYVLEKASSLPLEILKPQGGRDAALAGLSLGPWALDPAFAADTTQYAAIVGNEISSVTVSATIRSADATVQFLDGSDNALADADPQADGHQAGLNPGPNTIRIKVSAADGTTTRTYSLLVTRDGPGGVCGRTTQVREGIVRALRGIDACAEVTGEHLSSIRSLLLRFENILALKSGDFAGLSSLGTLLLSGNQLTSLPEDVFAGLTSLRELWLENNRIDTLPAGVFAGLNSIERILLTGNQLESLPAGIFSNLASLRSLSVGYNRLSTLPAGIFSGLTALERIDIDGNRISGVSRQLFAGLTSLKHLSMQENPIGSLPADLFSGMNSLETLALYGLTLTELPGGIFSGLPSIKSIGIGGIQLSRIPDGLFSGLTTLDQLLMNGMGLDSLPDGIFSGLTGLETLWLADNNFSSLKEDTFSGLISLQRLGLRRNNLASLPAKLFSGLTALEDILLDGNQLRSLPPGIFLGLSSITELELQDNAVFPLPVAVSLEKVEAGSFKAIAPTAAPFAMEIEIAVSGSGEIDGGANTVTIPAGAVESAPVAVSRAEGATDPVTVDIRGLPNPPVDHQGYALEKEGASPLEVLPAADPGTNAELSALVLSAGALNPAFDQEITSYAATVGNAQSSITVTPTTVNANATVEYLDGGDQPLTDADTGTNGHQVALAVGETTVRVKVTAADTTTTRSYTIVITRSGATVEAEGVCGRTKQVSDAIVAALEDAKSCDEVTDGQLSGITGLDVAGENMEALRAGDFDGLSALELLKLGDNKLTGLPVAIFAELVDLDTLELQDNQLTSLSSDVFCGMSKLKTLNIAGNRLSGLSGNQFACVPELQILQVQGNQLSEIPGGIFNGLSSLAEVDLDGNTVNPLPLTVTLEKESDGQFKAVAPSGAPFPLVVPVSVSFAGEIAGGVSSVTVDTGALERTSIEVTRTSGTQDAVTADIGVLPSLPANHRGYALVKDSTLPVEVLPEVRTLPGVCGRTAQVRDAIVAEIDGIDACENVTDAHLESINQLNLNDESISSLQAGDFAGLTEMQFLEMENNELRTLPAGVFAGLGELQVLSLNYNQVTALSSGLLSDLTALQRIGMRGNRLGSLPAGIFSGLTQLRTVHLSGNQLTSLPSDVFSGLPAIEEIELSLNRLSELPADVFSGLTTLRFLRLTSNGLRELPAGVFSDLNSLGQLRLNSNGLRELPEGVFSGLTNLSELRLNDNRLSGLPAGTFSGLTRLQTLTLTRNDLDPFLLPLSLEKVGESKVKAVVPSGSPYRLVLPFSVSSAGESAGGESNITIAAGAVESGTVEITRIAGTEAAITVDLGNLPPLAQYHEGYGFEKSSSLPLTVLSATVPTQDAALKSLALSAGALDPVFAAETTSYAVAVANGVSTITVTPTTSDANATVSYLDGDDQSLADADTNLMGHQVNLDVGENTIQVRVTARDGTTTQTYSIALTRAMPVVRPGICGRTGQVRDALVAEISGVSACEDVTDTQLAAITSLNLSYKNIASLQSGDFAGLTGLTSLRLNNNDFTSVPSDLFSGLSALEALWLSYTPLSSLPPDVFSGLSALRVLNLDGNRFTTLPSGVFAGLNALTTLYLDNNRLSSLPSNVFSGLDALVVLSLYSNQFTTLPSGVFSGLGELGSLTLYSNRFSTLPAGLFSGLSNLKALDLAGNRLTVLSASEFSGLGSLETLGLNGNEIASLPANVFSGLSRLESLSLGGNEMTGLPAGVFSGLGALKHLDLSSNDLSNLPAQVFSGRTALSRLYLNGNQLEALPDGLFSGLTALGELNLSGNAVDPLPFTVSLEKVGTSQFKGTAPSAAPFTLELPVSVSDSAGIAGGASSVFIYKGQAESDQLSVTSSDSRQTEVNVDIGTLPELPDRHQGYALTKHESLPVAVQPQFISADATLSALSLSDGTLDPVFASGTARYTALVSNAVSSLTVTPTKGDSAATEAYLNADGQALADADGNARGHQVDLDVGENTIRIKVTAEDSSTTQTYTIVVTRNTAPRITTTSPVSVKENATEVITLAATDEDGHDISWSKNGGADADRFELTSDGALTFESAPDYEKPADTGADNEYVVVVRASDGTDTSDLALTVAVEDVDESVPLSNDATLSGLSFTYQGLKPAFASETHSYRLNLGNSITSVRVTPTRSHAGAALEYLDENDQPLPGSATATSGLNVNLVVGENTIRLRVTAEDTTTTQTYTIIVHRLPISRYAPHIITSSPLTVPENQTAVATIEGEDRDGNEFTWTISGGADADQFNLTAGGVLTFATAPDFEDPADTDKDNRYLVEVQAEDTALNSSRRTFTVRIVDVDEGEVLTDNATLSGLSLSAGTLKPVFYSGDTSYTALVANANSTITVTPTRRDADASLVFQQASDEELADADANTSGHQVDLNPGPNTIKVRVTAEDGVTTETYTITVARNRIPRITITSPVSIAENKTEVATLTATDADRHEKYWSTNGGADQSQFSLTEKGVLTFVTPPDYESPADADKNNDYEVVVRVADVLDASELTLTVTVTNVNDGDAALDDATLSALSLSDGSLSPAFSSGTTNYAASVGGSVSSVTVTPTTRNTNATFALLDVRDDTIDDAGANTDGHQVNLSVGKNTIKVQVTAEDTVTTETYTLVVTRGTATGVCARTEQVRDAIVEAVSGVDACGAVTDSHLSAITALDVAGSNISSLQSGDFSGMTGLESLKLSNNSLTTLPADVFSGLTALQDLRFYANDLSSLPSGVFSGLTALRRLALGANELSSLPSGVFSGLTSLRYLGLFDNNLSNLPAGLFSGLSSLETITLGSNGLTALPSGLFSGLTALDDLRLGNNALTELSSDDFSGLTALEYLGLSQNRLSSLPNGLLSGLTALDELKLGGNTVDPLPFSVSLESVGDNQFKAVVPTGAPFAMDLPVNVNSNGAIEGEAGSVTVSTGAVESSALTVTRVSGTTGAVTVDLGTLPSLPAKHGGYTLEKNSSLPLTVLDATSGTPPDDVVADASLADVNGNGRIEADDAMIVYHAIESAGSLGDGESGGTPGSRTLLLAGLTDAPDPGDDTLREMLRKAILWQELGAEVGGDMNGDGAIDGDDAMIMHYAFTFQDLLGNGETGGAARFRKALLANRAAGPNPSDADLKDLLRNAHALRAQLP